MIHVVVVSPDQYKEMLRTGKIDNEEVERIYVESCGLVFLFFYTDYGMGEKKLFVPENTFTVCSDAVKEAVKRLSSREFTSSL